MCSADENKMLDALPLEISGSVVVRTRAVLSMRPVPCHAETPLGIGTCVRQSVVSVSDPQLGISASQLEG